ncbi:hypothetical protein PT2222_110068 [Paraburkholderia tropica]
MMNIKRKAHRQTFETAFLTISGLIAMPSPNPPDPDRPRVPNPQLEANPRRSRHHAYAI